ncbi:MAG: cytochrome c [Bryobacterales bacterium]|nr:cytochrome c [Bryobacterales bacterium]
MHDPPRYRLDAGTDFFGDRRAARPAIKGTVARNMVKSANPAFWTGKADGKEVEQLPVPFNREMLERGRDRYNIYCTPCHGYTGYGDGMIVTRGLKTPPSYHTEALRDAPIGHFFVVITNGSGAMASYAARIPARDRWAIAAYVRALQQSQNVKVAALTADEMRKVDAGPAITGPPPPPSEKEAAK